MADVPQERMALYERLWWKPVHSDVRVKETNWVVLRWPTPSMAQAAGKSTEAFEDFYFDVCAGVDYAAMSRAQKPLVDLLTRTQRVRITGPGTELSFTKRGIPAVECSGDRNIPDGECFTCPEKDSVNGTITFNTETLYRGTIFNNVKLTFKDGRITNASADTPANSTKLNEILDADAGARYIGEWSLAFNPFITAPMKDILFDEKIAGSFHLTPGNAYDEADNGNRSKVHWDLVQIQRPEYGGGTIAFDGVPIRVDGKFVPEALQALDPE
jgi:aminopeptidase